MTFAFPLPSLFWYPTHIFKKIAPSTQFCLNLYFPVQKKKGLDRERERIMCSNLKIYVIKFDSFCLLLEYFDFFWMICSCLPFLIWFFAKTQNFHFLDHPPIKREKTNPYGNFSKQTNLKDSSVFQEVKIFGWFTILVIHFKIHF